jgi:hypothetical protein
MISSLKHKTLDVPACGAQRALHANRLSHEMRKILAAMSDQERTGFAPDIGNRTRWPFVSRFSRAKEARPHRELGLRTEVEHPRDRQTAAQIEVGRVNAMSAA